MSIVSSVLAYDPATKCGWARVTVNEDGQQIWMAGTLDLSSSRHEGGGMRYLRFVQAVKEHLASLAPGPTVVAYEEVRYHAGTDAAHIYGGLVGSLTALLENRKIPYTAIPVGTVKKHATGKGNANKDAMLEAAREKWEGEGAIQKITDHNAADALWIADYVLNVELYS